MKHLWPIRILLTPHGCAWVVLIALLAVGAMGLVTPGVPSSPTAARDFSAERALGHVASIAREPHPIGSPAANEVRRYLVDQLTAIGLRPTLQEFGAPDYIGIAHGPVTGVNVVARIPGTESTGAILLMAHYDSVPTTPGANDDASGVAVVLETARALQEGEQCRNDIVVLLTDGEEPAPRYGASAFVDQHPWADEVSTTALT